MRKLMVAVVGLYWWKNHHSGHLAKGVFFGACEEMVFAGFGKLRRGG
jgi:hypothetical protein